MCKLPEPETYALGMDEFVLGRVHRYLCEDVCYGGLDGLEDILEKPLQTSPPEAEGQRPPSDFPH